MLTNMTLIENLNTFGQTKRDALAAFYFQGSDTGALARSVKHEVEKTDNGYKLSWTALDYSYNYDYGRGSAKKASIPEGSFLAALIGWVGRKFPNLNDKQRKQKANSLRYFINKFGIKPRNTKAVETVFNDNDIKTFIEKIAGQQIEQVQTILFNPKQWQ